jgi:hypothetical protein
VEDALSSKKVYESQARATNEYEVKLTKAFAQTDHLEVFQ